MIDRGADVMYAERFGVSDAAKERNVKVIGNVIDTSAQYPGTVLASALWHMEPTIDRAIEGRDGGHASRPPTMGPFSYMAHGGASLAARRRSSSPAGRAKLVKDKEKEIIDGLFRVNVNDAEPKAS